MKFFQVNEDDLAELERSLPLLANPIRPDLTNADRATIRRVQTIMTNIRWGYAPPGHVEIVEEDGGAA